MKYATCFLLKQKFAFLFNLFLTFIMLFGCATFVSADSKKTEKSASVKHLKKKAAEKRKIKIRKAKARKTRKKKRNSSLEISNPPAEEEFEGDGEKREDWFTSQRAFPFNEIPADARRKAWLSRPADAFSGDTLTAAAGWHPIGPMPTSPDKPNNWGLVSGRINAIAVSPSNPKLILIGAATGGIWRSIDGGTTFAPTTDSQIDLAVGSIAFAPSDNSIVYAGMGDKDESYFGSGVLKSIDGGESWSRVSDDSLVAPGRISNILVDESDPDHVYVAQTYFRNGGTATAGFTITASGFWYSNDGGVSWTKTISGIAKDLVRHPTQPDTLYLAMLRVDDRTPSTSGVFKSINAGLTWTRIYTSPLTITSNIKIAVTPAAPQNVYVSLGYLAGKNNPNNTVRLGVSEDEGASWTNRGAAFDSGQLNYDFYLFVHPTDPDTIFVATRDLWRTTDGGATYSNLTNNFSITGSYNPRASKAHPDQHHFYISPTNPNLMYLANDGGIYRSINNGNTFQSLNKNLSLTQFTSLAMHPTNSKISYGGTQDNGTQKRNGNNLDWKQFDAGDGGQAVVDPLVPSIVYTNYHNNAVKRFINNGDLFSADIIKETTFWDGEKTDRSSFYPPFVGNDVDSTLYFGTYRLNISTNRGASWNVGTTDLTKNDSDTLSAIGVGHTNTNVIYTGSAKGTVAVSKDAGANWIYANNGLPERFIKSIIVSRTDANTAYLTVSGFDSGHVFKTTDAGTNWTDISGDLPNSPTNTLFIDYRNPNTLYVGTDLGVYRSLTDGTNWEFFNEGIPPTIISKLDGQRSGLMQAATYGRGVYEINLYSNSNRSPKIELNGADKADISKFQLSNDTWFQQRSTTGIFSRQPGTNGILPAPNDFLQKR